MNPMKHSTQIAETTNIAVGRMYLKWVAGNLWSRMDDKEVVLLLAALEPLSPVVVPPPPPLEEPPPRPMILKESTLDRIEVDSKSTEISKRPLQ